MVDFYNKTFNDYFSRQDTLIKDFYILKDSSMPENLITDYANFKLHFVDWSNVCQLIKKGEISTLFEVQKSVDFYRVNIFIYTRDFGIKRVFRILKINGKIKLICGKVCYYTISEGILTIKGSLIYDYQSEEWKYKYNQ